MLESAFEVADIVVVTIRVGKEIVVLGEDVCGTDVGSWQECGFGSLDFIDLFGIVAEVFAELVAKVGVGVFISNDLDWIVDSYGAVICGDDYLCVSESKLAEEFAQGGVAEP